MTGRGRRLSFVTQWFAPEPITVPVWISQAMTRADWSVSVLTGVPNFPTGRVQPGYSAWRTVEEQINDVKVRRTPLFPSHDGSALRRTANYLSWAVSATVLGGRVLRNSDVSLVYSSPATAALPAMAARLLRGKPYVLMIQDLWPDSIFASGFLTRGVVRAVAEAVTGWFVQATYQGAARIAVISPGMKTVLERRGVPSHKISVVFNWVDEQALGDQEADPSWRDELGIPSGDFVLMYAGTHGFAQDLRTALEGFGLLPDSSKAHLVLVGEGVEKSCLMELAAAIAPERIHFLAPRPAADMGATMAAADAQLVSLKDDPLFHITMPSKVQAIMCAGQPVIVAAPGDAARVVEEANAGVAVKPGNPKAVMEAVRHLEQMDVARRRVLGQNGRRFYLREMSEEIGVDRLSQLLSAATGEASRSLNGERA